MRRDPGGTRRRNRSAAAGSCGPRQSGARNVAAPRLCRCLRLRVRPRCACCVAWPSALEGGGNPAAWGLARWFFKVRDPSAISAFRGGTPTRPASRVRHRIADLVRHGPAYRVRGEYRPSRALRPTCGAKRPPCADGRTRTDYHEKACRPRGGGGRNGGGRRSETTSAADLDGEGRADVPVG
jgi:hypothetical protein